MRPASYENKARRRVERLSLFYEHLGFRTIVKSLSCKHVRRHSRGSAADTGEEAIDLPMGASFSVWFAFRRWGFGHENGFCSLFDARRGVEHFVPRQFDGRVRRSEVSTERTEHLQQHQP